MYFEAGLVSKIDELDLDRVALLSPIDDLASTVNAVEFSKYQSIFFDRGVNFVFFLSRMLIDKVSDFILKILKIIAFN